MCVKKRRHMEIDTVGSRLGFRTFQRFYEINSSGKKLKSVQEFIDSQYYVGFVKFGHHLATLKPLHTDQFIDFVIRNSVSLKDWTKDVVYYTYLTELIKKEPADTAVSRTITNIIEWSEKNNTPFSEFFSSVNANEAAYMIKTGRISPWVFYLSNTGVKLEERFTDDHKPMIRDMIDAGFWMKKFKKHDDDVEYIRNILDQSGL
jgi:hypothetical protein